MNAIGTSSQTGPTDGYFALNNAAYNTADSIKIHYKSFDPNNLNNKPLLDTLENGDDLLLRRIGDLDDFASWQIISKTANDAKNYMEYNIQAFGNGTSTDLTTTSGSEQYYLAFTRRGKQGEIGLKGDVGAQGSQGEKGDTGQTGSIGSKGEKGDQGPAGGDGAKGETGSQGPQGPVGTTAYDFIVACSDETSDITAGEQMRFHVPRNITVTQVGTSLNAFRKDFAVTVSVDGAPLSEIPVRGAVLVLSTLSEAVDVPAGSFITVFIKNAPETGTNGLKVYIIATLK